MCRNWSEPGKALGGRVETAERRTGRPLQLPCRVGALGGAHEVWGYDGVASVQGLVNVPAAGWRAQCRHTLAARHIRIGIVRTSRLHIPDAFEAVCTYLRLYDQYVYICQHAAVERLLVQLFRLCEVALSALVESLSLALAKRGSVAQDASAAFGAAGMRGGLLAHFGTQSCLDLVWNKQRTGAAQRLLVFVRQRFSLLPVL